MTREKEGKLLKELAELVNRNGLENESNTPDHVLAGYLLDCIKAQTKVTKRRDNWFGHKQDILGDHKTAWKV